MAKKYIFTQEEAIRVGGAVKAHEQNGVIAVPPRFQRRRMYAGSTGGGTTPGGGSGSTPCCTGCYETGSVDRASYEWADKYKISFSDVAIGDIYVVDQGTYWESAEFDVDCDAGTDGYKVKMEATGITPGDVDVTIYMTTGGSGGNSACCDQVAAGYTAKWTNCCIVDPLCGFSVNRDPGGFTGRFCAPGDCSLCVIPVANTVTRTCECDTSDVVSIDLPEYYQCTISGFGGTWVDGARTYTLTAMNRTFQNGPALNNSTAINECSLSGTSCQIWGFTDGSSVDKIDTCNVRLVKFTNCTYRLYVSVSLVSDNISVSSSIVKYMSDPITPADEAELEAWLLLPKTISHCDFIPTSGTAGDLYIEPGV